MTKVILSLQTPKDPGEAALLLVEQMRDAFVLWQVKAKPECDEGMRAWFGSAESVLADAKKQKARA